MWYSYSEENVGFLMAWTYLWHLCVSDDPCRRWLSTAAIVENGGCVHSDMWSDWQKSVQEISAEVGISDGSIHSIRQKYFNVHYPLQQIVLKILTPEEKEAQYGSFRVSSIFPRLVTTHRFCE